MPPHQRGRTQRNFWRVMERDRGLCRYCGDEANSVDHVIPFAYRPDNSVGNLVAACMPCNLAASDMVFPSFEVKRDWVLERRRINDRAEQLAIEAAHDAVPLVIDDPGELLVQDAIWGEPEEGEEEYVPHPEEQLTAERWTSWPPVIPGGPCGARTRKGRPCRLPGDECLIHSPADRAAAAEAQRAGRDTPEMLEEAQRDDQRRARAKAAQPRAAAARKAAGARAAEARRAANARDTAVRKEAKANAAEAQEAEARKIRAQVRAALGPKATEAAIAKAVKAAAEQREAARKAQGEGAFWWTSVRP